MKRLLRALVLALLPLTGWAQESQTAYNFLRLPMSAHAATLGGDNITLIEDDASLVFGNPALLSSVSDRTIGLNYMNYMSGSNMLSASYTFALGKRATLAGTAQYFNYGTMKETSPDATQTGEFSAKDIAIGAHFSYLLTDRLAGGVAARVITSYIGDYNSLAVGVDLGLNYYDPDREWSISLVARNLGGQIDAYQDDFEKMPIDVQAGVSKRILHTPFRLSATLVDLNHWNYTFRNHIVMGADVLLSDQIWIGLGYNFRRADEMKITNNEGEESNHGAGLSLGGGINLERFKLNLAYGKYHVSSHSLLINLAYTL